MNNQLILKSIIIPLLLSSPTFSSAHLSIQSAQMIIGHKPNLGIHPEEHLAFSVDGGTTYYSDKAGNVPAYFSPQLTFNQFSVKSVFSSLSNAYIDEDGDEAALTDSIIADTDFPVISWKDATGKIIPESEYNTEIDGCKMMNYRQPLTLVLTANNVTVKSEFGTPLENNIGTVEKEYTIFAGNVCYLQPYGMQDSSNAQWWGWNGTQFVANAGVQTENGGGYTADFNPLYGFVTKPSVSSQTFPTTAITGAQFQLVMNSAQSDYKYTVLENGGLSPNVTIDNLGNVTLKNKTTNEITIKAKPDMPRMQEIEYKFKVNLWLKVNTANRLSTYPEATVFCGGEQNIPNRTELSNSPFAFKDIPLVGPSIRNAGTRGIGNFSSEWYGAVSPNIPLDTMYLVWTNEVSNTSKDKFTVYLGSFLLGMIKEDYYDADYEIRNTVCKL